MDIDEVAMPDEPKLNQRDKKLLMNEVDNPEENYNPFASGFKDLGHYQDEDEPMETPTGPKPDFMNYTPIKALATGFSDWQIKARIIKKYEKRNYAAKDGR